MVNNPSGSRDHEHIPGSRNTHTPARFPVPTQHNIMDNRNKNHGKNHDDIRDHKREGKRFGNRSGKCVHCAT